MGFETKKENWAIFYAQVWTYPMGFETDRWKRILQERRGLNIPYGIWNRAKALLSRIRGWMFEHTLWDLKQIGMKLHMALMAKFEHTLWDLKPGIYRQQDGEIWVWTYPMGFETEKAVVLNQLRSLSLNIPYGIWNVLHSSSRILTLKFEHTLWDLKRSSSLTLIMAPIFVWTYPMGFETFAYTHKYLQVVWFEHTLWDLKQEKWSK